MALEAVYEIARIIIQVSAQATACTLFGEDFNSGTTVGWTFQNAIWQVVDGKLQTGEIAANFFAVAEHALPAPNFFRLTADVGVRNFNGFAYGFYPLVDEPVVQRGGVEILGDWCGCRRAGAGRVFRIRLECQPVDPVHRRKLWAYQQPGDRMDCRRCPVAGQWDGPHLS